MSTFPLRKLKKLRTDSRIPQKKLASVLNCSIQFYSQLERGVNTLSYENACLLAGFFDTTPDALFLDDVLYAMSKPEAKKNKLKK